MNESINIMNENYVLNRMRHVSLREKPDNMVQIEFSYIGDKLKVFLGHTGRDVCLKRIMLPADQSKHVVDQLEAKNKAFRWR